MRRLLEIYIAKKVEQGLIWMLGLVYLRIEVEFPPIGAFDMPR